VSLVYPKSAVHELEQERAEEQRIAAATLEFSTQVRAAEVTSIQRSSGILRGERSGGTTLRLEGGRKVFVTDPPSVVVAKFQAAGLPVPEELC